MKRFSSIGALALAGLLISPAWGQKSATGPVPLGQPGQEIAAVKQTFVRMAKVQSLGEMASYFSNETAAVFGFVMMIPISFAAAFDSPDAKKPNPVQKEMETFLKRYGLEDSSKSPSEEQIKRLLAKGRLFLTDMDAFLNRLAKSKKIKDAGGSFDKKKMNATLNSASFKVISPTRVKITSKEMEGQNVEARVEEGAWRLHLIGLEDLKKMQNTSQGAPQRAR